MSVGFPAVKADFDTRAGALATALRDDLARWNQFYTLVTSSTWGQANLVGIGYSSGEATTLIAAATDLGASTGASLFNLARAGATLGSANDFWFNAKLLCGVV